jgi:UDP-glucose 4-epimerase
VKVGVTGGAGFIGSHVVSELLLNGHDVVIFDRRARVPAYDSSPFGSVEIMMGDVTDWVAMSELAAHCDGIIHLAACLGTQETIQDPAPAVMTNTLGGLYFANACRTRGIPGVNICVGNHWEDNSYSISKSSVERYIKMFNAYNGTKINQVRAVNAYGPGQSMAPPFGPAKVRKITPAFIGRALTGQAIEVYGDGQQISDMVYVRDVAKALRMALEAAAENKVLPEPVGVGPSKHLSVNQVAHSVREVVVRLGGPGQPPLTHVAMRPGETPHAKVTVDPETLRQIGMDPIDLVPFSVGIETTVAWYLTNWLPQYKADIIGGDTVNMAAV